MKTITTPGSSFTIASSWEEVSLGQFLQLKRADNSSIDVLRCLVSDPAALLSLDAKALDELLVALPFLANQPIFKDLPLPKEVADVQLPSPITTLTLGHAWAFEDWVSQTLLPGQGVMLTNSAVGILTAYLYPRLTGKPFDVDSKYRSSEFDAVRQRIEAIPVTKALPLAAFLLEMWENPPLPAKGTITIVHSDPKAPKPSAWAVRLLRQVFKPAGKPGAKTQPAH